MGNLNDMLAAFRAEVTHTTGDGRVWWQRGYADQLLYEAFSEMAQRPSPGCANI